MPAPPHGGAGICTAGRRVVPSHPIPAAPVTSVSGHFSPFNSYDGPLLPTQGLYFWHFFLLFVRMRFAVAAVALVATLQCYSAGVSASAAPSATPLQDAAAKKAVEELVAVPIDLMWKDVYEALVHKKGSRALRKLRFLVSSFRVVGSFSAL